VSLKTRSIFDGPKTKLSHLRNANEKAICHGTRRDMSVKAVCYKIQRFLGQALAMADNSFTGKRYRKASSYRFVLILEICIVHNYTPG